MLSVKVDLPDDGACREQAKVALDELKVTIERGPDAGAAQQVFSVPAYDNQTVLDVVSWVQQNADPTLSYRFACRVGTVSYTHLTLPTIYSV